MQFGSTAPNTICAGGTPSARAAVTYSSDFTCSTAARTCRMIGGTETTATA